MTPAPPAVQLKTIEAISAHMALRDDHLCAAPTAPVPLTTRAPSSISPPPTTIVDVIGWLRTIAAKTTALTGSMSAMMLAFRTLAYAKTQL